MDQFLGQVKMWHQPLHRQLSSTLEEIKKTDSKLNELLQKSTDIEDKRQIEAFFFILILKFWHSL